MVSERRPGNESSQTDNAASSSNGGNEPAPAFMYVHYLTEREDPPFPVYLFQIGDPARLEEEIKEAIYAIYRNEVKEVKPGANGVEWRVYSYAVFALSRPGSRITHVNFKHREKGGNNTFKYPKHIDNFGGRFSAVYYTNVRRNKDDEPLGNRSDIVDWEAHHTHVAAKEAAIIVTHQSSDPNTGP